MVLKKNIYHFLEKHFFILSRLICTSRLKRANDETKATLPNLKIFDKKTKFMIDSHKPSTISIHQRLYLTHI